jgi:hypothetical protein
MEFKCFHNRGTQNDTLKDPSDFNAPEWVPVLQMKLRNEWEYK